MFHNPGAGIEDVTGEHLTSAISDAGHSVTYQSIKADGWRSASTRHTDLYVAAGGDGTVCEVIRELAGTEALIGLIPLGTANNIARTLGHPIGDLEASIASWRSTDPHDICRFDVPVLASETVRRRFVESFGGGLFADLLVTADAAQERGHIAGELDDALALLRRLLESPPAVRPWSLSLDGRDLSGDYVGVEVMNIQSIGPRVDLSPSADPGDGMFDLVALEERHLSALSASLRSFDFGHTENLQLTDLPVFRGRHLAVRAPGDSALHVDDRSWPDSGEFSGSLDLEVQMDGTYVRVLAGSARSTGH